MEAKRELPCGGDAVEVEVEVEDVDAWLAEEAELTALSVLRDELANGGFKIVDANKQGIAYVYGHADPRHAGGGGGDEIDGDVDTWMVELIGGDVGGDAVKEHPVIPASRC
jgi:hypothetical protein